jgi:hypothetical protein
MVHLCFGRLDRLFRSNEIFMVFSHLSDYYRQYLAFITRRQREVLVVVVAYVVLSIAFMLWQNISITPDRLTLVLFIAALALGQGLLFLRDWTPFIVLLFAYEGLRGFADGFMQVNVTNVISAERWIAGGTVPTIQFQHQLYHAGHLAWYDYGATFMYFMHFPLPLLLAFYLLLRHRRAYWQFVTSFVVLCFSAFATFIIFPAAPPWMAARDGYLPPVVKIIDQVLAVFPNRMNISYLYHALNANQVAAMPSLHAAFPWLVFLTLWRVFGKRALLFLPYCIALWLSIIYLGEHYAVDAIAGILFAQVSFMVGGYLVHAWGDMHIQLWFSRLTGRQCSSDHDLVVWRESGE